MILNSLIKSLVYLFVIVIHLLFIYVGYKFIQLGMSMWGTTLMPKTNSLKGQIQEILTSYFGEYASNFLSILCFISGSAYLLIMTASLVLFIFRNKEWIP